MGAEAHHDRDPAGAGPTSRRASGRRSRIRQAAHCLVGKVVIPDESFAGPSGDPDEWHRATGTPDRRGITLSAPPCGVARWSARLGNATSHVYPYGCPAMTSQSAPIIAPAPRGPMTLPPSADRATTAALKNHPAAAPFDAVVAALRQSVRQAPIAVTRGGRRALLFR